MEEHAALKEEVAKYRVAAFADSTKSAYKSQIKCYFKFCNKLNIVPVPASPEVVAEYAAHLAHRLNQFRVI